MPDDDKDKDKDKKSPFDPEGGKKARDEGIARGRKHANPAWSAAWLESIKLAARRWEFFTSDDILREFIAMRVNVTTHDNRARGGMMHVARRLGYCELADGIPHRPSAQRVCHRRKMDVWKSLIFQG